MLRFIAALGMGGEWSLGVALVMEVWPNRSRAFMAGLIGAAGNVGYLLVGVIGLGLAAVIGRADRRLCSTSACPKTGSTCSPRNQGWRIMMILGTAPALLTFFIRLFVPESDAGSTSRARGATVHWASRDLLGVLVGAAGPGVIIYLWAWPHDSAVRASSARSWACRWRRSATRIPRCAICNGKQIRRRSRACLPTCSRRMLLAAGLSGVALLGTWGATQWAPTWADKLRPAAEATPRRSITRKSASAAGAILGTLLAAMLGDWLGRRITYTLLCVASLGSLLLLYQGNTEYGPHVARLHVLGRPLHRLVLRLAAAVPAGAVPHAACEPPARASASTSAASWPPSAPCKPATCSPTAIQIGSRRFAGGYPFACSAMSLIYLVGFVADLVLPPRPGASRCRSERTVELAEC